MTWLARVASRWSPTCFNLGSNLSCFALHAYFAGIYDALRGRLGLSPVYVPLAGPLGSVSFMALVGGQCEEARQLRALGSFAVPTRLPHTQPSSSPSLGYAMIVCPLQNEVELKSYYAKHPAVKQASPQHCTALVPCVLVLAAASSCFVQW